MGRVVLVTGAASGIGAAAATTLAGAGWTVSLSDRDHRVAGVAERLGARHAIVDVTDDRAVSDWVARERPDALVHCAGALIGGRLVDATDDTWIQSLDVNLLGTMRALRAFARARVGCGGGGTAVLVASNSAFWPARGLGPYCAAKAAVCMLAKCAASELGEHGIRVNVLAPGETRTAMTASTLAIAGVEDEIVRRTPLGRVGEASDVAAFVPLLLSDEAGWLTGQVISVDGGISLRGESDVIPE